MARFHFFILFSALLASSASADPCPQDGSANNPLGTNSGTISTSGQAAIQELPESPDVSKARAAAKKHKLYQITLSGQGSSGAPKTVFVDLTENEIQTLGNASNPGYAQANADLNAAASLFFKATDQAQCPAGVQVCGPQTFAQYQSLLASQAGGMTQNAKTLFGSMLLGNKLASLYHANTGITPLPTVFQALITNAANAGECRDIMTFIAVSMRSLGLKCGVVGADWNNGTITGAHVNAECQDPKSGTYTFINYGDAYNTGDKILSEAAEKASLNLNPYSTVIQLNSVDANGNGKLWEIQGPRTQQIQKTIDQASDPNSANFQLALGNLESSGSAHAKVLGGDDNNIVVFGTGAMNRQGDSYDMLAAGVRVDAGTQIQTSDHTEVDLQGKTKNGILYVQDQCPAGDLNCSPGGGRSTTAFFTNTQGEADLAWNKSAASGNSGYVGVKAQMQDAIYTHGGFGAGNLPYDTISVVAVDNPTKNLQLHFSDTGFVSNTTQQNIHIGFHQLDTAAGAKYTKSLNDGRLTLSNDVTGYSFGRGDFGVTNTLQLTMKQGRWGDMGAYAKAGYLHNGSGDAFTVYPTTCKAGVNWHKETNHGVVEGYGEYNCNQHNAFSLFDLDDPDGMIAPPKEKFGVNWRF